jgi:hypothetical protein
MIMTQELSLFIVLERVDDDTVEFDTTNPAYNKISGEGTLMPAALQSLFSLGDNKSLCGFPTTL